MVHSSIHALLLDWPLITSLSCTEGEIKVCTRLRDISSCSCLTGPSWVLLSKTNKPLFPPLYMAIIQPPGSIYWLIPLIFCGFIVMNSSGFAPSELITCLTNHPYSICHAWPYIAGLVNVSFWSMAVYPPLFIGSFFWYDLYFVYVTIVGIIFTTRN